MNLALLIETAQAMLANGKGLLAMGESTDTCNRRFDSANIVQTVEMRRAYQCLRRVVPAAVPGIMFLSGGQSGEEASTRLNAMHVGHDLPWTLSFSFARAIQYPALDIWAGKDRNRVTAQQALVH